MILYWINTTGMTHLKATAFLSITFSPESCRLWDNVEKYGSDRQATDDSVIWHMCTECRVNKATDTHSEYMILIAFLWQKWLSEHASLLRLYIHCLLCSVTLVGTRDSSARNPRHEKPVAGQSPFCNITQAFRQIYFYCNQTTLSKQIIIVRFF